MQKKNGELVRKNGELGNKNKQSLENMAIEIESERLMFIKYKGEVQEELQGLRLELQETLGEMDEVNREN